MKREISIKAMRPDGTEIPGSIQVYENYSLLVFFGGPVKIGPVQGQPDGHLFIQITSYAFTRQKREAVSQYLPTAKSLKLETNVNIRITNADEIRNIEAEVEAEIDLARSAKQALKDAQPKQYVRYDFLDWGDYAINHEREILLCREPLPDEGDALIIVETVANLWNSRIGGYEEEWKSMTGMPRKVGNYREDLGLLEITREEAEKWIARAEEATEKEAVAAAEKEAAKKAAAEVAAKFEQARATGEKVMIESCFLIGDDIPRKYRDEDSDMGHIIRWAMPDGSTKETFSHSY